MKTLSVIFTLLLGLGIASADTGNLSNMRFAGVWFYRTQDEQAVAGQFPVGHLYGGRRESVEDSVAVQEKHSDLARVLYEKMQKEKQPGGNRLLDRLDDGDGELASTQGDALVMACALNYEHVEVQRLPLGKKTISKTLAEIGFDLVLCNFRDRRIVAIFPLRAQIADAEDGVPTEERKRELLRHLYETKVVDVFMEAARRTYDTENAPKTLGIGELKFFDVAMASVPESLRESIHTYYSSYICAAFYDAVGVPVLPYSGGNELLYYSMREQVDDAAQLSVRTAEDDASALSVTSDGTRSFVLKKPDYTLDVVIPGFQTQVLAKKKHQRHLGFVSACRITMKEGDKTLYTSKYIDSVQAMYTHDAKLGIPWIYYQAATYKMLKGAAQKLSKQKETKSAIFTCSTK